MDGAVKYSILVVDDEKPNLNVLHFILRRDYVVYLAKDGQTALDLAEEYQPDLILLDIILPDLDGYEVITRLKTSERTKDIPVIFITGLNSDKDMEKGLQLGAADYIAKPFSAGIVLGKVRQQISGT